MPIARPTRWASWPSGDRARIRRTLAGSGTGPACAGRRCWPATGWHAVRRGHALARGAGTGVRGGTLGRRRDRRHRGRWGKGSDRSAAAHSGPAANRRRQIRSRRRRELPASRRARPATDRRSSLPLVAASGAHGQADNPKPKFGILTGLPLRASRATSPALRKQACLGTLFRFASCWPTRLPGLPGGTGNGA